jgi:hypothetical protein
MRAQPVRSDVALNAIAFIERRAIALALANDHSRSDRSPFLHPAQLPVELTRSCLYNVLSLISHNALIPGTYWRSLFRSRLNCFRSLPPNPFLSYLLLIFERERRFHAASSVIERGAMQTQQAHQIWLPSCPEPGHLLHHPLYPLHWLDGPHCILDFSFTIMS